MIHMLNERRSLSASHAGKRMIGQRSSVTIIINSNLSRPLLSLLLSFLFLFFSSRRRHTRCLSDWSSDVCSSDLAAVARAEVDLDLGLDQRGVGGLVPHPARVPVVLPVLLLQKRQEQHEPAVSAAEIGRASCRERV